MKNLEFRKLCPELEKPLSMFFTDLDASGTGHHFHPHPFTPEEAKRLCRYDGSDLYYVAVAEDRVLGYGMLRGWDQGYQTPSLGIAFHPDARGKGLGRLFMLFLHAAAKLRGANRIRLKVYPDNTAAVKLYESLGYRYPEKSDDQLVGFLDL